MHIFINSKTYFKLNTLKKGCKIVRMGYIFAIPEAVKQMPWFHGECGSGAELMVGLELKDLYQLL